MSQIRKASTFDDSEHGSVRAYKKHKREHRDDRDVVGYNQFGVKDKHKFDKKFPFFRQPSEIGGFSVNMNREFQDDKSQLKFYIQPKERGVRFDLRKGYKDMIRKDESVKEYLNFILLWVGKHLDKFVLQGSSSDKQQHNIRNLNTDFVCWRGLITKLLCTPYENREGWKIGVTLFNGTYYLCEFETAEKKQREENKTEREDEMCCWGWKFEQYLTGDTPSSVPDTDSDFNNCENFCTVVRSRLNQHSLVFSGEVDAISVDKKSKPHYVEMKTTREITHPRQAVSVKRFKYIKWWAQSFLVGIPEIVCGYRNDDGIVTRLESLQTQTIPDLVKDLHNPWKPNVCFNFLDEFLSFIKQSIKTDDHRTVYLLSWNPGEDVTCRKQAPGSEFMFLPEWYTNTT